MVGQTRRTDAYVPPLEAIGYELRVREPDWYQHREGVDHYQAEIDHLGIGRSPAFHYEPETNGCAEKAIQTLKEQILWIERFDTLDELRTAVRAFGRTYNQHWLIERHEYRTPTEAREHPRGRDVLRAAKAI